MSSGTRAAARRSVPWSDGEGIICTHLFEQFLDIGKHFFGRNLVAIGGEVHAIKLKVIRRQFSDVLYRWYLEFPDITATLGTAGKQYQSFPIEQCLYDGLDTPLAVVILG